MGAALLALATGAEATTTEQIVVDPASGLAISGFDPVAYFMAGRPVQGNPEHEARWMDAPWHFVNAGNRTAFLTHPNIYAPRFGGHDPVRAAYGFAVRGDPYIFIVVRDRLYLFMSEENRDAFRAAPDQFLAEADRNWPRLAAGLAR
jgi:hypothetical protein